MLPHTQNSKHPDLLSSILSLLLAKGLKGLTMDLLASELSMSKRTLYEIFGSKQALIERTLDYMFSKMHDMCAYIFKTSPDVITALSDMFHLHAELLCMLTIDFFHDIDTLYPDIKQMYDEKRINNLQHWQRVYLRGVEEGVLRTDVNYQVLLEMMHVQMEALKRMEDRFAGQFTLDEIFSTITGGFLRSIASTKGLQIIESYKAKPSKPLHISFTETY